MGLTPPSPTPNRQLAILQGNWQVEQRWVAKRVDQPWFRGVVALAAKVSRRAPIDIGSPALYLSDGQALCHGLVRISQKGDHHYGDAKEA